jgi:putative membrane protein insertion efficiency factor
MKNILVFLLKLYKKIISPLIDSVFGKGSVCRFSETCSEYSMRVIKEEGALKGIFLSVVRLSKCQPFYKVSTQYESI